MRLAKDYSAKYRIPKESEEPVVIKEKKVRSTVRLRRKKEREVVATLLDVPKEDVRVMLTSQALVAKLYRDHKIKVEGTTAVDTAVKFINSFGWSVLVNQLRNSEFQVLLNRVKTDGSSDTIEKISTSVAVAVFSALDAVMSRSFKL